MTKMGRLLEMYHVLCMAHGIHLAVCDILYTKRAAQDRTPDSDEELEDNADQESIDGEEGHFTIVEDNVGQEEVLENHGEIINKVRKIVRFFRKSPLRNDHLQMLLRDQKGKELHLVADVRTRWNTLFKCLERFYDIRYSIHISKRHF